MDNLSNELIDMTINGKLIKLAARLGEVNDLKAIKDEEGKNLLILAAENNRYSIVSVLLDKDIDINMQDNSGKTALIHACMNSHHKTIFLLIRKKGNVDYSIKDNQGKTALQYSIENADKKSLKIFKKAGIETKI